MSSAVDYSTYMVIGTGGSARRYDYKRILVRELDMKSPADDDRYFMFWLPPPFAFGYNLSRSFNSFFYGAKHNQNGYLLYTAYRPGELSEEETIRVLQGKALRVFYGADGLYQFFTHIGYNYRKKRYE